MALNADYVVVKCGEERFRIAVRPEWRALSDNDGLTLLKHKISESCGTFPQKLTDEDGITIQSLETLVPRETLLVQEAPPQYEDLAQVQPGVTKMHIFWKTKMFNTSGQNFLRNSNAVAIWKSEVLNEILKSPR